MGCDDGQRHPFVVIYQHHTKGQKVSKKKVGVTEIVHEDQYPEFETKIDVNFEFCETNLFSAEVYYAVDEEGSYDEEGEMDVAN